MADSYVTRSLYSHLSTKNAVKNNTKTEPFTDITRAPRGTCGTTLQPSIFPDALTASNLAFSLDEFDKLQKCSVDRVAVVHRSNGQKQQFGRYSECISTT